MSPCVCVCVCICSCVHLRILWPVISAVNVVIMTYDKDLSLVWGVMENLLSVERKPDCLVKGCTGRRPRHSAQKDPKHLTLTTTFPCNNSTTLHGKLCKALRRTAALRTLGAAGFLSFESLPRTHQPGFARMYMSPFGCGRGVALHNFFLHNALTVLIWV